MSYHLLTQTILNLNYLKAEEVDNLTRNFDLKQIQRDNWNSLDSHSQTKYFGNFLKLASVTHESLHNQFEFYEFLVFEIIKRKLKVYLIIQSLNNLGVLFLRNSQHLLAKKFFKCVTKHLIQLDSQNFVPLQFITLINLANIYYNERNYQKGFIYAEKALIKLEPYVFNQLKVQVDSPQQEIVLLLNGYMMFAKTLEKCSDESQSQIQPAKFYQNGVKLGRKYLGSNHYLTKKLIKHDKQYNDVLTGSFFNKRGSSELQIDYVEIVPVPKYLIIRGINLLMDVKMQFKDNNDQSKKALQSSIISITPDQRRRIKYKNQTETSEIKEYYFSENNSHRNSRPLFKFTRSPNSITINTQQDEKYQEIMKKGKNIRVQSAKPLKTTASTQPEGDDNEQSMQEKVEEHLNQRINILIPSGKIENMEHQLQTLQQQLQSSNSMKSQKDDQIEELKQFVKSLKQDQLTLSLQISDNQKTQEKYYKDNSSQQSMQLSQLQQQQTNIQSQLELQKQYQLDYQKQQIIESQKQQNQFDQYKQLQLDQQKHQQLSQSSEATDQKKSVDFKKTNSIPLNPVQSKFQNIQVQRKTQSSAPQIPQQIMDRYQSQHKKNTSEALVSELFPHNGSSEPQVKGSLNLKSLDSQSEINQSQGSFLQDDILQLNFIDPKDNFQYLINLVVNQTFAQSIIQNQFTYIITCTLISVKSKQIKINDCVLQIKVIQVQGDKQIERQENIDINTLKTVQVSNHSQLLQYTEYQSVLPFTMPVKCISDYKSFIQYMVMPFIGIVNAQNDFKIEIWPKSPGFLTEESMKFNYADKTTPISFHHLQGYQFRLFIYRAETQILKFDLALDEGSFNTFFQQNYSDEYDYQEAQYIAKLLEVYDDVNFNEQSRSEVQQIVETRKSGQTNTFYLPSLKIKDQTKLFTYLQQIITEWEELLKKRGVRRDQLDDFFKENQIFKVCFVKTWNLGLNSRLSIMSAQKQGLDLQFMNAFETHAPDKGKIKAQGQSLIPYDELMKMFGCDYTKMSQNDLKMLCTYLLQVYNLDVFDKPLDDDDNGRVKENCISEINIDQAGCFRHFIPNGHMSPFTMTYLGINDKPIGIRAQVFNPDTLTEKGLFIVLNPESWLKPEKEEVKDPKNKKRAKRFTKEYAVTNKYWIPQILQRVGWKMVIDCMNVYNDISVDISLRNRQQSVIERFENLITFKSVLEYLEK